MVAKDPRAKYGRDPFSTRICCSLSSAGDKLVIVDFYSRGCGGCNALLPKDRFNASLPASRRASTEFIQPVLIGVAFYLGTMKHKDGYIVCPTTDNTFDLRTGAIREWYLKNLVLRVLIPALRTLYIFPVKTDDENIYISMQGGLRFDASAEIVFSGRAQPGVTTTDVNVDEVIIIMESSMSTPNDDFGKLKC